MSNTNIDNKDLEKLGEFVKENKESGYAVIDAIRNGDVDCSFNVDLSAIEATYPTIGGVEAVVGGIEFNSPADASVVISDRGIVIPTATYSLGKLDDSELRENILGMNQAITANVESENNFKLRDQSYSFMLQKDKSKINFKFYLGTCFKKDEKDLKNKFIKDLYNTKMLYKDYKHLNFATKRLILNNRLRANVIKYCSDMEIAATDILVLLENDSDIFTYIFGHLPAAIRKMIDRGIDL